MPADLTRADGAASAVVLISGTGTLLQALIDAAGAPDFGLAIVAVGSDRPGVAGLARAEAAGIPTFVVPVADHPSREAWDRALTAKVSAYAPDLVISAGFMKLVGEHFLAAYAGRMINTHPALLPSFPGMHGPRDALAYGVKITGATVFLVDAGVDTGVILDQVAVPVARRRHRGLATRADQDRRARAAGGRGPPAGHPALAGCRQEGDVGMTDATRRPIRRALVSVYDKTELAAVGRALVEAGAEIVSTGSTARTLAEAGLPVTQIEQVTGFGECLDGRVKTLHPAVHAGLLADLRLESHRTQLGELGIASFDLLVSNLYPFSATVASGATPDECVEQIDIGGPAMVRSSAKNHASVAVVTSPGQYPQLFDALAAGGFTLDQRQQLAAEAFAHTAAYDIAVAGWLRQEVTESAEPFSSWAGASWRLAEVLRYGENPHQQAALYRTRGRATSGLAAARQLHGKPMSYNNYVDADAARRSAYDFSAPAVAIIKHANPCGIAVGTDIAEAHRKAHACDPVSAFGGVIAANRPVSVAMAEQVAEVFTEVVLAPGFDDGAIEVLAAKKNIRLLEVEPYAGAGAGAAGRSTAGSWCRPGTGPTRSTTGPRTGNWWRGSRHRRRCWPTWSSRGPRSDRSSPTPSCWPATAPRSGWGWARSTGSTPAGWRCSGPATGSRGSVAASDAFFPFADGPQILLDAGVSAIVQPGGSVRDDEVIAAVRACGATMYLTGARHFFH